MKLVNLGCGQKYHKDWINIDFFSSNEYVIQHNLLEGIPIEDNAIDVVYHSHVLEHFTKSDGFYFIEECYRVLNKNGIVRIAVPNLEIIVKEYLENLQLAIEGNVEAKNNYKWIKLELFDQMIRNESGGDMKNYLYQPIIENETYVYKRIGSEAKKIRDSFLNKSVINNYDNNEIKLKVSILKSLLKKVKTIIIKIRIGKQKKALTEQELKALKIGQFRLSGEIHQWMYDRYSLSELLREVGFTEIKVCNAFESEIQNWETYQLDVINGEVRKPDSLFIEAKKL
ncbi:methyltransferase domain-containing protein [Flavobacterium aquidurense]|uniref:class I SAM-dependent methyltransferase n=1 Tax=Flavobacterium aquidurense TaxID=362413 RepID=UPI00285F45AB|nr:methyltransferase domain-containing protein [Flavobacterium aquidurense]MDR7372332.1 putative SAM-dependent methyltransferase [Flavobacterium aquidurense]